MTKFTAAIECDFFTYDVMADISEMGVNVLAVYFGGEALNHNQLIHFITVYGATDLEEEVIRQYNELVEDQRKDCLIEAWEIRSLRWR